MHPAAVEAIRVAQDAVAAGQNTAVMLSVLGPKILPGHPKAELAGRSCGFPQVIGSAPFIWSDADLILHHTLGICWGRARYY